MTARGVDFPVVLDLMRRGKLSVVPLVTHRHPLDDINAGFDQPRRGEGDPPHRRARRGMTDGRRALGDRARPRGDPEHRRHVPQHDRGRTIVVGAAVVHLDQPFALARRDALVAAAASGPILEADRAGDRARAALLDAGSNLLGVIPSGL